MSKLVYVSTEFDRSESKEFLGQANFEQKSTWQDYVEGCRGIDPADSPNLYIAPRVGAIGLGDVEFLKRVLTQT